MTLDLSKIREAIRIKDRLNVFAEFLNVLEAVIVLTKVDCAAHDTEFTKKIISGQRRLKELCEAVYARLVETDDAQNVAGLLSELESEASAFETQNAANKN